jgi:hypothetical protein
VSAYLWVGSHGRQLLRTAASVLMSLTQHLRQTRCFVVLRQGALASNCSPDSFCSCYSAAVDSFTAAHTCTLAWRLFYHAYMNGTAYRVKLLLVLCLVQLGGALHLFGALLLSGGWQRSSRSELVAWHRY